jgi:hypothetical protein
MKIPIKRRIHSRRDGSSRNFIYFLGVLALILSMTVGALVFVHFQLGVDLMWVEIKNPQTAQYWGQIGDFIGGVLNPLLSFFALMAVLYNLMLQREELALARRDAKDAQDIQNKQSNIFKQQNFESVFFRLLDVHSQLSTNLKIQARRGVTIADYQGADAFEKIVKIYFTESVLISECLELGEGQVDAVQKNSQDFLSAYVESVGHYFRNIYQILKYVDGMGQISSGSPSKAPMGMEIRRAMRSYRLQRDYANILRAQLSSNEVACLFLNCLSQQGLGLKYYVEKYSMLKNLERGVVKYDSGILNLYSSLAYADYEDMEMADIISHIRMRYDSKV